MSNAHSFHVARDSICGLHKARATLPIMQRGSARERRILAAQLIEKRVFLALHAVSQAKSRENNSGSAEGETDRTEGWRR